MEKVIRWGHTLINQSTCHTSISIVLQLHAATHKQLRASALLSMRARARLYRSRDCVCLDAHISDGNDVPPPHRIGNSRTQNTHKKSYIQITDNLPQNQLALNSLVRLRTEYGTHRGIASANTCIIIIIRPGKQAQNGYVCAGFLCRRCGCTHMLNLLIVLFSRFVSFFFGFPNIYKQ